MPYRLSTSVETTAAARRAQNRWRKAHPNYHARWVEQNRDKARSAEAKYRKANLGKYAAKEGKRRAAKRKALPELTLEDRIRITALYVEARILTRLIGEPYHVDHIKPLAKGGLHHPDNLQVMLGADNLRKGSRLNGE